MIRCWSGDKRTCWPLMSGIIIGRARSSICCRIHPLLHAAQTHRTCQSRTSPGRFANTKSVWSRWAVARSDLNILGFAARSDASSLNKRALLSVHLRASGTPPRRKKCTWSSVSMVGVYGHLGQPIDGMATAPALSRVRFVQLARSHWLDVDVAFVLAGLWARAAGSYRGHAYLLAPDRGYSQPASVGRKSAAPSAANCRLRVGPCPTMMVWNDTFCLRRLWPFQFIAAHPSPAVRRRCASTPPGTGRRPRSGERRNAATAPDAQPNRASPG